MAFPFIFHSNFESGSNAEWDSESDTGGRLDFPHYSDLARIPGMPAPYRGAYCMRIVCGDTNDHTLTEGDIDIADGAQRFFRFALWASNDFTATADDTFNIFELQQAGGTVEASLGMRVTAATNALEIGIGDGTAPTSFFALARGRWTQVELEMTVSTSDVGTLTLYLDGGQAIALTALDQAAGVGQGVLGTQNTLATTTGTLLFDGFAMDDARLYQDNERFPTVIKSFKSEHAFVGPGWVESCAILSATGTMKLWDTDTANTNASSAKVELDTSGSFVGFDGGVYFERGCYVQLAGTNPVGEVRLLTSSDKPGRVGPTAYGSDGAIRLYGSKRKDRPQNA